MRPAVLGIMVVLLGVAALGSIWLGTPLQTLLGGGLLVVIALPLLAAARKQLGSASSVGPRAKGLVTQGLYALIPHPMYVFLDLALLGLVIMLRQTWLLVVWAAVIVFQAWQARREAAVLEEAFGDAYREYRKRTLW